MNEPTRCDSVGDAGWCYRYGRGGGGTYDSRGKSYDRNVGSYQTYSHDASNTTTVGPGGGAGGYNSYLSRSMSTENWRDAKSAHATDDDYRGGATASRAAGGGASWGN